MKGEVNRAEARQSLCGFGYGTTCRAKAIESEERFRFDTPVTAVALSIISALLSLSKKMKRYTFPNVENSDICKIRSGYNINIYSKL